MWWVVLCALISFSSCQATLLLPKDQHPSNVPVTAEFIKDHVAICDASAGSRTTSVTTLSGLRGSITEYAVEDNPELLNVLICVECKPFVLWCDVQQCAYFPIYTVTDVETVPSSLDAIYPQRRSCLFVAPA